MVVRDSGYEFEIDDSGRVTMSTYDAMTGHRDGFISMDLGILDLIRLDTKIAQIIANRDRSQRRVVNGKARQDC